MSYDEIQRIATNPPDLIDEVDESTFYLGYLQAGRNADFTTIPPTPVYTHALIIRIRKVGNVWYREYAEGRPEYMFNWANRAAFNYLPIL